MTIAVQRVIHLNLNVSRLERALPLFTDVLGLAALGHMRAEPQQGAGMGLAGLVQWNGRSIHDDRLWAGTMIDLLEWLQPATVAPAATAPESAGFNALRVHVPDVAAVRERALVAGFDCGALLRAADGTACALLRDSDGARFELRGHAGPARLAGVVLNTPDLARSAHWFCAQLGFVALAAGAEHEEDGAAHGCGGRVRFLEQSLVLSQAEPAGFRIVLRQWLAPAGSGAPLAAANRAGYYRLALAVEDAQTAYEALCAAGVDCPYPPVWLDMGPDVPVDGLWALFFRDPDGNCVELIQNPVLTA